MKKVFKMRFLVALVAILSVAVFVAGCGGKQKAKEEKLNFPTKPITIINPFSAGGSADTTARVLAKYAKKYVGQPVVVENRPGGGGTIGQAAGAKATPDGYTLTLITPSAIYGSILNPNLSFTYKSFAPINQIIHDGDYLVVRNEKPFNDFDSFIAYAKANPGKVKFGNSGAGTSDSLSASEFAKLAGVEFTHIPFDGNSVLMSSLLGGHIDVALVNWSDIETKVKAGELKAIAYCASQRSTMAPDVPTTFEKGIKLESGSYRGLAAPAGTDPKIIKYLEDAFKKTMEDPEYQEQMKKLGMPVTYLSSTDYANKMKADYERFERFLNNKK